MIDKSEFRRHAHKMVDWMADYMENIEKYPVKSQVNPGDILKKLPEDPPNDGETYDQIMQDFSRQILPGITHWQHPSFFAYFPASNSDPSVLAEMLTATIGAQCMMWATSPSAAEMEERMMDWIKDMLALPSTWHGVIQDTASTATLVAMLTAREVHSHFKINQHGFSMEKFRLYCSEQAHSSVEKGVAIAGFGRENLRMIKCDDAFAMIPSELEKTIVNDIEAGLEPVFVVGALGTTGSTAIDPIDDIGAIARKYNLWYHVDAAHAGAALILPEFRNRFKALELADSFVFNPHKWMFTNFDCSAYFVKDKESLVRTFSLTPEYLRTREENAVNNYKDWGIQLGRRFRALKLWFVIRTLGVKGIRDLIQSHIKLGQWLGDEIQRHRNFELMAPVPLNTVCFRFNPGNLEGAPLDKLNEELMHILNSTGKLYITHTRLKGNISLRLVAGQANVQKSHVERAWALIQENAEMLYRKDYKGH